MGAVGYKTLDGSLSKWVITAICLINGAQFFLAPDSAVDMYEMKGVSKLGKAMIGMLVAQFLSVARTSRRCSRTSPRASVRLRDGHVRSDRGQIRPHGSRLPQRPQGRSARLGRDLGRPRLQGAQLDVTPQSNRHTKLQP